MQKQKVSLVVGAVLVVVAVTLALSHLSRSGENVTAPDNLRPSNVKSARAESLPPKKGANTQKTASSDLSAGNTQAPVVARETILEQIQDAAVSYDAAELPKIEPYLLHPDQEIRQAAMNGMITLGDGAAGPLLRKAASHALTPQEAVALMEAADYVELPSGKLRRRSK